MPGNSKTEIACVQCSSALVDLKPRHQYTVSIAWGCVLRLELSASRLATFLGLVSCRWVNIYGSWLNCQSWGNILKKTRCMPVRKLIGEDLDLFLERCLLITKGEILSTEQWSGQDINSKGRCFQAMADVLEWTQVLASQPRNLVDISRLMAPNAGEFGFRDAYFLPPTLNIHDWRITATIRAFRISVLRRGQQWVCLDYPDSCRCFGLQKGFPSDGRGFELLRLRIWCDVRASSDIRMPSLEP